MRESLFGANFRNNLTYEDSWWTAISKDGQLNEELMYMAIIYSFILLAYFEFVFSHIHVRYQSAANYVSIFFYHLEKDPKSFFTAGEPF